MSSSIYTKEYRNLISKLVSARQGTGLTQRQIAMKLDKSVSWLSAVEKCSIKPDLVLFCRLCSVYCLDPGELLKHMIKEGDQ